MGTNYYVVENHCECCDRYDKAYHIGKSSFGWSFSFRGYRHTVAPQPLTSWAEWKDFLRGKMIRDEYGYTMDYEEFCTMIETIKSPGHVNPNGRRNLQHNEEGRKGARPWFDSHYDWDDEDGYSFSSREFS